MKRPLFVGLSRRFAVLFVVGVARASAHAQSRAAPPIVHTLPISGPGTTTSPSTFTQLIQVRQLADGRVLGNDAGERRVMLLDPALANPIAVIDSAANGPTRSYGQRVGTLMPFAGDSSLFFDSTDQSFILLDPLGRIVRIMASPIPTALVTAIITSTYSVAVYSPNRGLLYTGAKQNPVPPTPGVPGGFTTRDDSSAVLVAHFDTHLLDTVSAIKRAESVVRANASGSISLTSQIYAAVDEWSGFADGTIGILRGRDLHLELHQPDGSVKMLPKIPYEWQHLDDALKQHLTDSISAARLKVYNDRLATQAARGPGRGGGGGGGGGGGAGGASAAGRAGGPPQPDPFDSSTLPDYFPVFIRGGMRGDLDGNFWIQLAPPAAGAPNAYMVVNREGIPVDRVAIPDGASLIGFGPNGTVYVTTTDGSSMHLIRTHWK